jgi:hypothetical protein
MPQIDQSQIGAGLAFLRTSPSRRSISPKRLSAPGPTSSELEMMISAALMAPDHRNLRPKLRALLQRRKGRDLFDLNEGLSQLKLDAAKVVACFEHYIGLEGVKVTRAHAEQRMLEKLRHSLTEDVAPMLPVGVAYGGKEARAAFTRIWIELIARISGDAWKSTPAAVQELRKTLGADFLKGAI